MAYISFQPSDYFNTVLYTGNASTQSITGVGFQPDWTWLKTRVAGSDHQAFDAVRTATYRISPNTTSAQTQETASLTSFDSDGFSIGNYYPFNSSGADIVSWNWKAGTTTGIAGSPSITPTSYSFNATSGFSIIKYSGNATAGATLPHGLGVAPKFVIVKRTDGAAGWNIYHASLGATKYLNFTNGAAGTGTTRWNDTEPTSTLFSLGTETDVNGSGGTFIAYCFADVKGFSKFGSYTGNGNADGTFVYTGFQPAFTIVKQTDATNNWGMCDNKRNQNSNTQDNGKGNYTPHTLATNSAGAESAFGSGTSNKQDYLSNGFKFRDSNPYGNSSGSPYIYWAFAEFPTVSSNDIPATAR